VQSSLLAAHLQVPAETEAVRDVAYSGHAAGLVDEHVVLLVVDRQQACGGVAVVSFR
jgi:hypothetical protein